MNVVGLMSGTSLDGLDISWVSFSEGYKFRVIRSKSIAYNKEMLTRLKGAHELSGLDLMRLSNDFAVFCADAVNDFLGDDSANIHLLSSHGHTVFHNPKEQLTTQIGNGAILYAKTGIKTVTDFRSVDIALGGQGAPLVPIGDDLLFSKYDSCLNLGGIANISFKARSGMMAQDLCFANMLSNYICQHYFSIPFDRSGELGSEGKVDPLLLEEMIAFHRSDNSLSREDFKIFMKKVHNHSIKPKDLLRSAYQYTSSIIASYINGNGCKDVLVTGGGAHNTFLVSLLKKQIKAKVNVPEPELVDFKEAIIFAFLGLLRVKEEINVLKNVTKASSNNIGGAVYG